MPEQDLQQFYVLKREIARTYQRAHPACVRSIHEWKGQDIVNFQEHLQESVKGRISEKWFYTHIKAKENERLPRIDMLNMLSEYVGYEDWQAFKFEHRSVDSNAAAEKASSKRAWVKWGGGIGVSVLLGLMIWAFTSPKPKHTFCFTDATTGKALVQAKPEVFLLEEGESPRKVACDKKGCLKLKRSKDYVTFIVSAPYYRTDTIVRRLDGSGGEEEIDLQSDDYALMIHYFSADKQKDWGKRREQLQAIFSDNARIFQVSPNNALGMELFNKQEFINKLTTPIRSLGQIEVLETNYEAGKIVSMRFIQKEEK